MRSNLRRLVLMAAVSAACGDDGAAGDPTATSSSSGSPMSSGDPMGTSSSGGEPTSGGPSTGQGSSSADAGSTSLDTGEGTSGASGSTGEVRGDQWADVEITYVSGGGSNTVVLDDCTFCDATIDSGVALIRFQQAEGWTVWSVYVPTSFGPGEHPLTPDGTGAYVVINEANPDLPSSVHGFYPFSSNVGTVTLSEADFTPGGTVAGVIAAELSLGDVTATFDAEFSAVLSAL